MLHCCWPLQSHENMRTHHDSSLPWYMYSLLTYGGAQSLNDVFHGLLRGNQPKPGGGLFGNAPQISVRNLLSIVPVLRHLLTSWMLQTLFSFYISILPRGKNSPAANSYPIPYVLRVIRFKRGHSKKCPLPFDTLCILLEIGPKRSCGHVCLSSCCENSPPM